ncbi:MAG: phosphatidylserine decarboxylase family protein [Prevotellaceae bacterium]|jgi:phosphatidylserine decarboxylase|nr:phosphatidylserine decarboxylase family protein [Prevotellaceae bacterium]
MILHKEGKTFVIVAVIFFLAVLAVVLILGKYQWLAALAFVLPVFMLCFFRNPKRPFAQASGTVLSPCDGKVVIIQEVEEPEYFNDKRLQVSVFMSVWNVHINWIPMGGKVMYFRHHQGKYLIAKYPKASELNERTSCVIDNGKTQILFRQIAGYVARRIVSYIKEGDSVEQNAQLGFIKFGSRMDIFLPIGTEICVKVGDKVKGTETAIAKLQKQ